MISSNFLVTTEPVPVFILHNSFVRSIFATIPIFKGTLFSLVIFYKCLLPYIDFSKIGSAFKYFCLACSDGEQERLCTISAIFTLVASLFKLI